MLFSSHLLDEVERVADRLAIVHEGRIVMTAAIAEIKHQHRRMTLRFSQSLDQAPAFTGMLTNFGHGNEWTYNCVGEKSQLHRAAMELGATVVEDEGMSLDEIFVSRLQGASHNDRMVRH